MKVVLQCVRTRNYVRGVGSWTAIPEQALEFTELVSALDFALEHSLTGVRPVIRSDYSVAEVHLSVLNAAGV
jgi:hypothetical protein